MAKVVLYEDHMFVSEVDPDGKKFDKGTRRLCHLGHACAAAEHAFALQCRASGVAATSGRRTCRWT